MTFKLIGNIVYACLFASTALVSFGQGSETPSKRCPSQFQSDQIKDEENPTPYFDYNDPARVPRSRFGRDSYSGQQAQTQSQSAGEGPYSPY